MIQNQVFFEDVRHITSKEYFAKDEYAWSMFDAKYAHIKENGTVETPAEVFWRVCSGLSAMEECAGNSDILSQKWFSLMWNGWFRPGGSVLAGVGSTVIQSLANCTTVPLSHDSIEGIARCDYDVMKCAAYRQGLGIDVSVLRPAEALVNNAAQKSTGVVPWIKKLVSNGEYVGQHGRMPALLISLKDHHPDIRRFITSKMQADAIQNANISVQISDSFMHAVECDLDWELYFEFEDDEKPRISEIVKAREIFDLISETACFSAEPGVQYIDQLRAGSMTHQIYSATGDTRFKIISTNACSEKPLSAYNICNLLSINVGMFSTDPVEYKEQLDYIVPLIVRMSDNVITYELQHHLSPLPEQRWILEQTREIGCGITNVHEWFLSQGVAYASTEANDRLEEFFKQYAYRVFKSSVELGEEKGSAPSWDSVVDKKWFMGSSYYKNVIDTFYNGDPNAIKTMRNIAHMSIAPTGCGAVTNEILTDRGTLSIQDILDENGITKPSVEKIWIDLNTPLKVMVKQDTYQDVYKIFYNGEAETRRIVFEDGVCVDFTLNHPLLVGENFEEAAWVQVQDLKNGDNILQY